MFICVHACAGECESESERERVCWRRLEVERGQRREARVAQPDHVERPGGVLEGVPVTVAGGYRRRDVPRFAATGRGPPSPSWAWSAATTHEAARHWLAG